MDKWFVGALLKDKKVIDDKEKNVGRCEINADKISTVEQNVLHEQKKAEFQTMVENHEKNQQLIQETRQKILLDAIMRRYNNLDVIQENRESKKKIQMELAEISKVIRETQQSIKEVYQFEPCRQLCDLAINIQQKVYSNIEEIQEDLSYVIEAFGISKFEAVSDEIFDAKYHDQVESDFYDARGRKIDRVYSPGFQIDGEILVKAQVSVK